VRSPQRHATVAMEVLALLQGQVPDRPAGVTPSGQPLSLRRGRVGAIAATSVRLGAVGLLHVGSVCSGLGTRLYGRSTYLPGHSTPTSLTGGCDKGTDPTTRLTAGPRAAALSRKSGSARETEAGSAVVEFVLVSVVAVGLALAVAQLGLFLWERNALMGSLSEGVRVAATEGRTVADGRRVAIELLRRSAGGRVARAVSIEGVDAGGVVMLRAEGSLPSFLPGLPGMPVRMTARMHEEESL
jgi:hypothetical protein